MANTFGVGSRGSSIQIINELPDKLTKTEALNLAANIVAAALTIKGADPDRDLPKFFELVAEVCEDEAVAAKIRAELG